MKTCCMILADGFEEVEAIGTYGILVRGGLGVDLCGLSGTKATGRFGATIADLQPLPTSIERYDALVLPGGPGHRALEADARVAKLIECAIKEGKLVCAICASPSVLGRAGYLRGKRYTCFTAMNADFGGEYSDDYVVRDDNLITGKSAAASLEFGFAILDALLGSDAVTKTKKEIYYRQDGSGC